MTRNPYFLLIYFLVLFLLLVGCATTNLQKGQKAINEKDYAEAIDNLSLALEQNPEDNNILENLGLAYYQNRDFEKSINKK